MSFTSILTSTWTLLLISLCLLVYRLYHKYYAYFTKLHIPHNFPIFPFGNMGGVLLHWRSAYQLLISDYLQFKGHSFYGVYRFLTPIISVRDPKLIQKILLQDFDHFVDHQPLLIDPSVEPFIGRSLFTLNGDKWRDMRTTLSPAFTGSRMANMFSLMQETTKRGLQTMHGLQNPTGRQTYTHLKGVISKFVTDVTASVTFGVEVCNAMNYEWIFQKLIEMQSPTQINSFDEANNRFYHISQKSLNFGSIRNRLKIMIAGILYRLSSPVQFRYFGEKIVNHFSSLVLNAIAYRNVNNVRKSDVIQILLDAQRRYAEEEAASIMRPAHDELGSEDFRGVRRRRWDNDEMIAQCFMLFLTGHETITVTLTFVVNELVMNQDVQQRLIAEIDEFRRSCPDASLESNDLDKLKYLDTVLLETMRKWPIGIRLHRKCVKDYQLQDDRGNSVTIHTNDIIWLPIIGLHMDPEYFPDPHKFDPDRFSDQRKHLIQPFTYLPFGVGPRNCIASRFAMMQMKVFVYHLLSAFTLAKTPSTRPVQIPNGYHFKMAEIDIQLIPRT